MIVMRYVKDMLQLNSLPYLHGQAHAHFHIDNTHTHIARQNINFLRKARINIMPSPLYLTHVR